MSTWGAENIPNQSGRTFVVTGANSGLGAAVAHAVTATGGRLIMACRNVEKAQRVADNLGVGAEVRHLDLADLASVRAFAESVDEVDVLVNNAGVMIPPFGRTVDGFETQVGVNHLGHFALTGLLVDKIRDRVVTVSSFLHVRGRVDLADLNWERRQYRRWPAYAQSKLANLLFAYELQRRLTARGSTVQSVAAHPGYADTNLQSHSGTWLDTVMAAGNRLLAQSAEQGALPVLYAATADIEPGAFYGPNGFLEMRGGPSRVSSYGVSNDPELAADLWALSERLTGVLGWP